jgi:hypothetical protein
VTIFWTVFSGVLTFVLGQIVLKLVIEPVHEFKKTIADIALSLIEYANIYSNPGVTGEEKEKQVSEKLRNLASRINAHMYLIPYTALTSGLFGLPSHPKVLASVHDLIGLSNSVFKSPSDLVPTNLMRAERIRIALGIHALENK